MADKVSTIFTSTNQKYYTSQPAPAKKSTARNIVAFLVTVLGVVLTAYFGYLLVTRLGSSSSKPYLIADVYYGKAKVFVDGTQVGETPLENFVVKKGLRKIKLESEGASYETSITFNPGLPGLVKRDLGVDQIFSAGLDLWTEKSSTGTNLSIISEPSEAVVFIDGTVSGKTPYSTDKLTAGAYDVRLEKEGYEPISERINIVDKQKLNASFKLFSLPAPVSVKLLEGSTNLYDMVSANSFVITNPKAWADALIYWNKTRGINIMGYGINRELVFDYILDFNGVFYGVDGAVVEPEKLVLGDGKIAYLRREADGAGITSPAKESLAKIGTGVAGGKTVKVKDTGLGWLRVRSEPSLNGAEVGRVNTGDTVSVLEEKTGWLQIKSSTGLTGWASADYLEILK